MWIAEDYEPLPPGLYVGKLLDIESRKSANGENGEYRRWSWDVIEGPHAGRKVYANTSTNFGPQAKARQWVENILDRELEAGEQVGIEDLVGGKHHLMIENVREMDARLTTCRPCTSTEDKRLVAGPCCSQPRPLTEGVMTLYTREQKTTDKKILPLKPENIPDELKVRPQ